MPTPQSGGTISTKITLQTFSKIENGCNKNFPSSQKSRKQMQVLLLSSKLVLAPEILPFLSLPIIKIQISKFMRAISPRKRSM
jgi:hypothetical protein